MNPTPCSARLALALVSLVLIATLAAAQAPVWSEFETNIPLPRRTEAHPFALHPTPDGGLALAWMSGADGRGALYTAFFADGKWSEPEKILELKRPRGFALLTWRGKVHLLECTRRYFAAREDGAWKRLPYPLPKSGRYPSVAHGKDGSVRIVYIAPVRRISRTPTRGAITEDAGKTFLVTLPAKGKKKKPKGLDTKSQSRASRPVVGVDPDGGVHVILERRYGRKARPNIGYVNLEKPRSALTVSRQPGDGPAISAVSAHEIVALWNDRPGVVECLYDGTRWQPPTTVVPGAKDPRLSQGAKRRLHLSVLTKSRSVYYLMRGPRGWTQPIDFGHASGSGRAVESTDGTVHLVWESRGTFKHRARSLEKPAPQPKKPEQG
jgi:hypothetical protein